MNKTLKTEIAVAAALIVIVLLSRFSSHLWNLTAVGGVALFAGSYFSKKNLAVGTVFLGLFISDLVLGFHNQMFAVYLSYAVIVGLGYFLHQNPSRLRIVGLAITGSVLFYIITNFAVWYSGLMYPVTAAGLLQSYMMGVPFFRAAVVADVVSAFLIFEMAAVLLPRTATKAV